MWAQGSRLLLPRNTCPFTSCIESVPCCILPSFLSPRTGHGRAAGELGWEPLPLVWSQWRAPGLAFLPVLSSSGLCPSPPERLSFVLTAPWTVQLSLTSCPCLGSLCVVSASVGSQFWYLTADYLTTLEVLGVAVLKLGTGPGSLRGGAPQGSPLLSKFSKL